MDGIYLEGIRPKSKKAVREMVASNPHGVHIECTSMYGGFSGAITKMANGDRKTFVGPDPYKKRDFYGTIIRKKDGSFKVE